MLILFNVKLFTTHFTVTSKENQNQEKCRCIKKCCHNKFVCNVIMQKTLPFCHTIINIYRAMFTHANSYDKTRNSLYNHVKRTFTVF